MRAAMIQMDMELGKPDKNFKRAEELVRMAVLEKPDVVTLPETWNVGFFPRENLAALSDQDCGCVRRVFSALAREYGVNLIAGTVANQKQDGGVYNTACVFDRKGNMIAQYDKVHLFSPSGEHEWFRNGNAPCNFELDGIRCSLAVCYDIRFPELIRTEMLAGSQIQFVVAQWPKSRQLHWDTLNRARAIESQCYLCCTNSVGAAGEIRCGGHSAVYGPMGECLILGGEREQILVADMDLEEVARVRAEINVYRDRRPEVYRL